MMTRITVHLPNDLIAAYDEQAKALGISVEALIVRRLSQCVLHTASKPLYIDDELRRELEVALSRNYNDALTLVQDIKRCLTLQVDGVAFGLSPQLLSRLKTRCTQGATFNAFIREQVIAGLEQYVGLR